MLFVLFALVPGLFVRIDAVVIAHGVPDFSVTESTQEVLIFISALLFGLCAVRNSDLKGFCVLSSGFLGCMLVRELDFLLDYIWHGFWFWPAMIIAISSIAYAVTTSRKTLLTEISSFIGTKPYFYISLGIIIVVFFSRIFGSGNLLWSDLLKANYTHEFKSALQEGLELFGYLFIFYGSLLYAKEKATKNPI